MTRSLEDIRESVVGSEEEAKDRRSVATVLVERALGRFKLLRSDEGETGATVKDGPPVVHPLRGGKRSVRGELARDHFLTFGRVAAQQALTDALATLEGMAQESEPERFWQRVAEHDGALWLDLGDDAGRAVRVVPAGWSVELPPVRFRRSVLTGVLPEPERGGDLDELWEWLNVAPEDRPLVLAFLVAALVPDIPHPIMGLFGEQGTGKTTTMKTLVLLIDPSPVPYRKPPRDAEAWVTAAAGSWVVALDNLRDIGDWLSDLLCRAVTGEGDVRRKLYSDSELALFQFRRVVALSGIDVGALNGDLADRLLPVTLERIPERQRREESSLWRAWRDAHPRILGALLTLAARVLELLPTIELDRRPRMIDFARIVAAVDEALGSSGLERYLGAQGRMAADSLTGDPFIVQLLEVGEGFEGTSAELLERLTPTSDSWRRPKDWPANARAVTQRMRRQAPVLRQAGWHVSDDGGANKSNAVQWRVSPHQEMVSEGGSPGSPGSPVRAGQVSGGEHHAQNPASVDSPPSPLTRRASAVQDSNTSVASQASQDSLLPLVTPSAVANGALERRAVQLAAELRPAGIDAWRNRYSAAIPHATRAPTFWADTARAEPLAVTIAVELLAHDEVADTICTPVPSYLSAARAAVNAEKS